MLKIVICIIFALLVVTEASILKDDSFKETGMQKSDAQLASCKCSDGKCENNDKGELVCKCPPEYGPVIRKGYAVEKCKECDCGKGFNCTFDYGRLWDSKYCTCTVGYKDRSGKCKADCSGTPCQNGGTCKVKGDVITCMCASGFSGDFCEKVSDPCTSSPCKNGGKCSSDKGKVKCSCSDTFSGDFCEIDLCNKTLCKNGGKCSIDKATRKPKCDCVKPYFGDLCEKECKCENGKCMDVKGALTCVCNPEYGLYEEGVCKACECGKAANCTFDPVLFFDDKKCICPKGFEEHGGTCVDMCSPNPCLNGGTCDAKSGKVNCNCSKPYTGDRCEKSPCDSTPCKNGGNCSIEKGNVKCSCPDPYTGDRCETNLCSPNPCLNNGTCAAKSGKVNCSCSKPYTGDRCEKSPCDSTPCKNGGKCSIDKGNVKCSCPDPYTGDRCQTNVCSPNPCLNSGTCAAKSGKVNCSCSKPYTGDRCQKSPCDSTPCKNGGNCSIEKGDVKCSCLDPYTGDRCETNVCSPNPCKNSGTCAAKSDKVNCSCSKPYTGDRCEKSPCDSTPCKNGGNCSIEKGNVNCSCPDPYAGDRCETNVCSPNPCLNGGTCAAKSGKVNCSCSKPYTGDRCQKKLPVSTLAPSTSSSVPPDSTPSASTTRASTSTTRTATDTTTPTTAGTTTPTTAGTTTPTTADTATPTTADTATPTNADTATATTADTTSPTSSVTVASTTFSASVGTASNFTTLNHTVEVITATSTPYPTSATSKPPTGTPSPPTSTTSKPSTGTTASSNNSEVFNETTTVVTDGMNNTIVTDYNTTDDIFNVTTTEFNVTETSNVTTTEFNVTETSNVTTTEFNVTETSNVTTTEFNVTEASNVTTTDFNVTETTVTDMDNFTSNPNTSQSQSTLTDEISSDTPTYQPVVDECRPNPCKNGGTCFQKVGGHKKCFCVYPYGGSLCVDSYWCAEGRGKDLCKQKNCDFNFETGVGYCKCSKGEYYDYKNLTCKTIDKCPLMPDKCKGANEICRNNECECSENFKKNDKNECTPNFCESKKSLCGENSECREQENSPGNVECVCNENYVFNGQTCVKANKCDLPSTLGCQQTCNSNTESCDCELGFTLHEDNTTCNLTDASKLCKTECGVGVCINSSNEEICVCPPTHVFDGKTCVDLCTAKKIPKGLCPNDECLPDEDLGFRCKCEGLLTYGEDNVTCRRKLMCSEGNASATCSVALGKCVDDFKSKEGFKCVCAEDEEMDTTDGLCKRKCHLKKYMDMCEEKAAVCEMEGSEASCKCPPMVMVNKDGICADVAKASYIGDFPFELNKYILAIQNSPSEETSLPDYSKTRQDLNDSMSLIFGDIFRSTEILNCSITTSSVMCTVEVQFDSDPKDQVKMIGEACIDSGSDTCFIPPQLVLFKKDVKSDILTKTDPCLPLIKERNCGGIETVCSKVGEDGRNYECSCTDGFFSDIKFHPVSDRRTVVHSCQDINECLSAESCPNGTDCMNTHGSFECPCLTGYKPLADNANTKEVGCADMCQPNPCGKGKCKVDGFYLKCSCDDGYTGENCDQKIGKALESNGMKIALITLSTIVIPLALLSAYMIHKYRILQNKFSKTGYFDDTSSTLSLDLMNPEG